MTVAVRRTLGGAAEFPIDLGVSFAWIAALYAVFPIVGISLAWLDIGRFRTSVLGMSFLN